MPPLRRSKEIPDAIVRELQDAILASSRPAPVRPRPKPRAPDPTPIPPSVSDFWTQPIRQNVLPTHGRTWSVMSLVPWFIGAVVVVVGLLAISGYGFHVKAKVVEQGSAAMSNLAAARDHLEQMDFSAAQHDFSQAYERFNQAHEELGIVGTGVGSVLARLPGGERIHTAQNLIEAGRLISEAGASLSKAVSAFSGGDLLSTETENKTSLAEVLLPMQKALSSADTAMSRATTLLSSIDPSALPGEARGQFDSFMKKLPEVRALIQHSTDAAAFVSRLAGTDHPRRYLLLFQNSSELRPTGGFPGSYGLVTLENGRMRDMTADDIYNPDGQIRQLVVPPLQLQHITPSWGMRDANWFIDFSASARKVMEFYRKGGGSDVDGVIALRPEILADILRITGPISLPKYDVVLTADNFLPIIQLEVESKKTPEPKKIIMDLTPLIIQKLSALPPQQWTHVLAIFQEALAERGMLMYMDDVQLQKYIVDQGWAGEVKKTDGDYLQVNISNIKGAKEDAVTDTSVKLESWLQSGTMVHRLTLTRANNGGHSEYGFYNKTNYSYVRVLVPEGSTLRGITGNDRPINRPMMDYAHEDTVRDPDLEQLEATYQYDAVRGETMAQESGKTSFGFWMKIAPGQTQAVQLEYAVPARVAASNYHLLVQRQPGLDLSDFEFTLQKDGVRGIDTAKPPLITWPDSWRLHDSLKEDLDISVTLK